MILGLIALAVLPATASATHDDYFTPVAINSPGTTLRSSYTTSDSTIGATQANFPNPFFCGSGGTNVWYSADVWFTFYPHRTGRYGLVVQSTTPGFRPVATVAPFSGTFFDLPNSKCNASTPPINRVTLPASGYLPLSAGQGYRIQVGGQNEPNLPDNAGGVLQGGNYNLAFSYDPDTDGDGLYDSQDRCDGQRGTLGNGGCPDTDGDGLVDPDDRCGFQRGPRNLQGCPDSDNDGRPDRDDRCPAYDASDRDPNRDGCLDLHLLVDSKIVPAGTYSGGRVIRSLRILKVPRGSRVSIGCRRSRGRRNCGNTLIKKATTANVRATLARTVRIRRVQGKRLPFGSKITIRVTKAGATGWYRSYTVLRSAKTFKLADRCTNVGSKKLRKRGCK